MRGLIQLIKYADPLCSFTKTLINTELRIIEAMKWAYAQRTKLGDPSDPEITDIVNQVFIFKIIFQSVIYLLMVDHVISSGTKCCKKGVLFHLYGIHLVPGFICNVT